MNGDKPKVAPKPAEPPPPPPVEQPDPESVLLKKRKEAAPIPSVIATILSAAMGGRRETLG